MVPSARITCLLRPAARYCIRTFATSSQQVSGQSSKGSKTRLDDYCLQQYPQYSKNVVQSWILQGRVTVNDRVVIKTGYQVSSASHIQIDFEEPKYVCRAGLKLEAALQHFNISVDGKVALDSGLSTGGFTDCLLQHGAKKVYGVDVGTNQVCQKIKNDPRVVVMEGVNTRYLRPEDISTPVDLVTLDLSFISVLKVLPAVTTVMKHDAELVVLIKPQFEAGKKEVGSGGVVRDATVRDAVVARVTEAIQQLGFENKGLIESPLKGSKKGNTEFLAYFHRIHILTREETASPPTQATC